MISEGLFILLLMTVFLTGCQNIFVDRLFTTKSTVDVVLISTGEKTTTDVILSEVTKKDCKFFICEE
jgi:cell division septal protein FtsQ